MKLFKLIFKNLGRNLLRTTLTAMGTVVLVFVVTLIWSILYFLDAATSDKASNFKAICTERWQIPSQMPFSYASGLSEGAARNPGDIKPDDSMTWQFFGGSLDPVKRTRENILFFFCLEPIKLRTMMDDLDTATGDDGRMIDEAVAKMNANKQGCVIGRERLEQIGKRVGERINVTGLNYKDIQLELEIVGTFPDGRYNLSAAMNRDYLNDALDDYARKTGKKHPMAAKTLNLVWLRVPDRESMSKIAAQIEASPNYSNPAVKVETASSGVSAFLDAYKDLIWGMRWLLSPAILVTLSLVISNAISISVRERRTEMAVLKVLGFRPAQILTLILGEALLVGTIAGAASAAATYLLINEYYGGIKFPIAFFGLFRVPTSALWWGLAVGAGTAFIGSVIPAWGARNVKAAEVFAKVA
jgi:putative ABC transport system permease protein